MEVLGELGITMNHDGTLAFDAKKFKTIELNTVKNAFDGNVALSYGSKIASRLNRIADSATSSGKIDSSSTTVATVYNSKSLIESIESLKGTDLYTTKNNAGDAVFNRDGVKTNLTSYASSIETNARLVNYYSTTQNNSTSGYSATGSYTNTSDIVSQLYGQI